MKPSTRERLYHIEREVQRHDRDFETIRQISLNGASVGAVQAVNERVDHVHTRIDRDVLPELKDLRKKRLVKDVLIIAGLVISMIGNIISMYNQYIK